MSFLDLLKIEFMKVKRSKIVPLIFIAPTFIGGGFRGCVFEQLLYTGIHQCVGCHVYSKCACLRLLSASIQHDRGLRDDRRTRNRK